LLGGAILPEVGSRYSYFLFVQPSRRSSIIIGRYIAAFIGSAIFLAVYYILAVLISVYLFSSVPFFPLLISFAETLLIILAILAFIVFIGASSDNPMAASMTAMFLLLFGFYFLMLILPIAYPTMEPWFMLNYAAESTYNGFSGTFQHVIVSNQSVQHQPPLPVVSGLNGFNVLSANCNAAGKNGNNYIVMILSDNFIGAIQLDWINFTLSNGTKISQPFENQTFPQGATFGVPVEAVANCSIPTSTPYVIGIRISYSQQGVSQPLNSLGTIYLNESDISPTYTYLTMDSYEPYPSESAEIATGYMIFFLSLGLLIYGRREVK
jgi:ABC-type transport system involved in multi-copper enzyme maturation permease subunit